MRKGVWSMSSPEILRYWNNECALHSGFVLYSGGIVSLPYSSWIWSDCDRPPSASSPPPSPLCLVLRLTSASGPPPPDPSDCALGSWSLSPAGEKDKRERACYQKTKWCMSCKYYRYARAKVGSRSVWALCTERVLNPIASHWSVALNCIMGNM